MFRLFFILSFVLSVSPCFGSGLKCSDLLELKSPEETLVQIVVSLFESGHLDIPQVESITADPEAQLTFIQGETTATLWIKPAIEEILRHDIDFRLVSETLTAFLEESRMVDEMKGDEERKTEAVLGFKRVQYQEEIKARQGSLHKASWKGQTAVVGVTPFLGEGAPNALVVFDPLKGSILEKLTIEGYHSYLSIYDSIETEEGTLLLVGTADGSSYNFPQDKISLLLYNLETRQVLNAFDLEHFPIAFVIYAKGSKFFIYGTEASGNSVYIFELGNEVKKRKVTLVRKTDSLIIDSPDDLKRASFEHQGEMHLTLFSRGSGEVHTINLEKGKKVTRSTRLFGLGVGPPTVFELKSGRKIGLYSDSFNGTVVFDPFNPLETVSLSPHISVCFYSRPRLLEQNSPSQILWAGPRGLLSFDVESEPCLDVLLNRSWFSIRTLFSRAIRWFVSKFFHPEIPDRGVEVNYRVLLPGFEHGGAQEFEFDGETFLVVNRALGSKIKPGLSLVGPLEGDKVRYLGSIEFEGDRKFEKIDHGLRFDHGDVLYWVIVRDNYQIQTYQVVGK